jgi:2-oxoisovalerate dehydrogenase E1 component
MASASIDGSDPDAVASAVAEARARGLAGAGPTFVECSVARLWGHYNADIEHYRPADEKAAAQERDPLVLLRARLAEQGAADGLDELEQSVAEEIAAARDAAVGAPLPDPATARDHVVAEPRRRSSPAAAPTSGTELTVAQAVNRALELELAAREELVLFGEDIATPGGVFGVTRNLQKQFGAERVFDTPIAEAAILGGALGASLEGLRPVVEIMWADFLLVALDQLVNQAANVRYIARGELSAPFVVRCQQGVTPGSCAQHSQSLEALLTHIPGLRVGIPATAADAFEMTRAAIADPDPCILVESRAIYGDKGLVDVDAEVQPIGGAALRTGGDDLALISWGRMANRCVEAAGQLADQGIHASVLDLRWLSPLDDEAIAEVTRRTSRVLIVHEANVTGGFGGEIAARIVDRHFDYLDAPVRRLGSPDVRYPSAPILQDALLPGVADIAAAARELVTL